MEKDVRWIKEHRKADMDGFAIVAWSREGDVSSAVRIQSGRYVGRVEVADFVKSAVYNHIFGQDK